MTTTDDTPRAVMLELFPADVQGEVLPKAYREVMAVVTDEKIYINSEDPSHEKPYHIMYEAPIYSIEGTGTRREWVVTLDDADRSQINIKRSRGCGCGSQLKGARMFRNATYRRVR